MQVVLASDRNASQRALGCVVVGLDPAVVDEARERCPVAQRVADRQCHRRLRRDLRQRRVQPRLQLAQHRTGALLANPHPFIRGLALDLGLHLEQLSNALQRLVRQRAAKLVLALVDVPYLAPRVRLMSSST